MRLPYFHLLPRAPTRRCCGARGERPDVVEALLEIKETGISIERFERTVADTGYRIAAAALYLVNPMYRFRYGLSRASSRGSSPGVPVLRDFVTTSAYYLLARA